MCVSYVCVSYNMEKKSALFMLCFYFVFIFFGVGVSCSPPIDGVYIVYMGAANSREGSLRRDHAVILETLLKRNDTVLLYNYKYAFSGFAARLSKEEAASVALKPGVLSVFPDPLLELRTTHSWDFLEEQSRVIIDSESKTKTLADTYSSSDIIIGVLDTGIWPEAESFSDKGMGPIPSHWTGSCMESPDFKLSDCNNKLIGARYYGQGTSRDSHGHGTHTASTAAGAVVPHASHYGLGEGTARGGFPESRLAIYNVCHKYGCPGSAVLAAFDDSIHDGVDILSISLTFDTPHSTPDWMIDPIAIGAFHAVERGIMVVCAAGNVGPWPETVLNDSPWILTVAATTIDRDFPSDVVLGDNKVVKGEAINVSPLSRSPKYPLIYGETAMKRGAKIHDARQCQPESLDRDKLKGKILLCNGENDAYYFEKTTIPMVKEAGGLGMVHIVDQGPIGMAASDFGYFPITEISRKDEQAIFQYIKSTRYPMATILPTVTVMDYKPAPVVAYFSSRGPSSLSKNILKPDIAAPGVNILAAWLGNVSKYKILSGTSMACPHVSAFAGKIKSLNPTWSASAIRSAIMTSATQTNNEKAPITTDSGELATPYDYGAGSLTTFGPLQPGLVYETSTADYLNYLCYIGFDTTEVKVISRTVPASFSCPEDSSSDLISNINYPSIAISNLDKRGGVVTVRRTVTNVGEKDEIEYSSFVDAPYGVNVKLIPDKLKFTKNSKTLSYQVIFSLTSTCLEETLSFLISKMCPASFSLKEDMFGSITWSTDKYTVRSPFVIAK